LLTSALDGGKWSHPGRFTLGQRATGTQFRGGWGAPEPVWRKRFMSFAYKVLQIKAWKVLLG